MEISISDIAASGWVPLLSAFLGYALKAITDWFQDRRTTTREREKRQESRRDQFLERLATFQRQTLLDLQEVAQQLARSVVEIYRHDQKSYHDTGKWRGELIPDELDERCRQAQARTSMLGSRVRDESVRELVEQLKDHATAMNSPDRAESQRAYLQLAFIQDALNKRIGEVLRQLDDADRLDS